MFQVFYVCLIAVFLFLLMDCMCRVHRRHTCECISPCEGSNFKFHIKIERFQTLKISCECSFDMRFNFFNICYATRKESVNDSLIFFKSITNPKRRRRRRRTKRFVQLLSLIAWTFLWSFEFKISYFEINFTLFFTQREKICHCCMHSS